MSGPKLQNEVEDLVEEALAALVQTTNDGARFLILARPDHGTWFVGSPYPAEYTVALLRDAADEIERGHTKHTVDIPVTKRDGDADKGN